MGVRGPNDSNSFPECCGACGGERGDKMVLEGCGGLDGTGRGVSIDASASSIFDRSKSYNNTPPFRMDFTHLDNVGCLVL